jgi:peroxiredoxin
MARAMFVPVFAASVLLAAAAAQAKVGIGDAAPSWAGLVGTDEAKHGLAEYKDAKIIVLAFLANGRTASQAYEERLVEIEKQYRGKGVKVIAVNISSLAEDRLDRMKKRVQTMRFNFPYLSDPTQKIGHDYGATVTPQVFVLDKGRKIAYIGAIDDNQDIARISKHYLRDALDAVLGGKKVARPVTTPVGTSIKYVK